MKRVKLNKLCEINIGKTPSRSNSNYWGKGNKWLSIADMKSKYLSETKEEITDLAVEKANMKIVPKNTVLMSFKLSIGKVGITKEDMYTNEAIASFPIIEKNKLNTEYLYYALKTLKFDKLSDRAVMGVTLNKAKLNQIVIPLPPINIQKKIVDILNKAEFLIEKRKAQIDALDQLTKSVFLEMFGDPMITTEWDTVEFGEICETRLGKMLDKKRQAQLLQKPYIGNRHVQWGHIILEDLPYMGFREDELEKFSLKNGDLLICEGGEVGRCAIWKWEDKEIYFQKALHRARVNRKLATPEYLQNVFYFYAHNNGFKDFTTAATIAHLTGVKLKKLPIPLPPISLQEKFADIYNKIDEKRTILNKGLVEIEKLYNSIMQKAFKGELFSEGKVSNL